MKFSIIMANYNCADYIAEAIESVLSQSYTKWELLIVDDASTDNSLDIISRYLFDERIKLIKNKQNIGYGGVCKIGVENSYGEIIGFLDSDDALKIDALRIMINAYKKYTDCGFIYSTCYQCDNKLNVVKVFDWVGKMVKGETNLRVQRIAHFRTFKKIFYEKIEGFSMDQKRSVDRDIINQFEEVTKFKYLNVPLYYYRWNDNGISQGKNQDKAKIFEILSKYRTYRRRLSTDFPNLSKYEMSNELMAGLIYSLKTFNYKRAKFFMLAFIRLAPFNIVAYLILFYRVLKFVFWRIPCKIPKSGKCLAERN